jgi:hypothetical protein
MNIFNSSIDRTKAVAQNSLVVILWNHNNTKLSTLYLLSLTITAGNPNMVLILPAALIGSSVTFALLWPYGAFLALISAPFGGSFLAILAGLLLAFVERQERKRSIQASHPPEKIEEAA